MTPEALRTLLIQGIDELYGRPLVLALLSAEQKRALAAQRAFWSQPNAPFNDVVVTSPTWRPSNPTTSTITGLLTYYQQEAK